jgi:hypothetical protein
MMESNLENNVKYIDIENKSFRAFKFLEIIDETEIIVHF